jgi:hypothetical protein
MTLMPVRARTIWLLRNGLLASRIAMPPPLPPYILSRAFSSTQSTTEEQKRPSDDPRINDIGRAIRDDFATIRENYGI